MIRKEYLPLLVLFCVFSYLFLGVWSFIILLFLSIVSLFVRGLDLLAREKAVSEMEEHLPSFIMKFVDGVKNGNPMVALHEASQDEGGLGREVVRALSLYMFGSRARGAFENLTEKIRSKYIRRTFLWIVWSIERGLDVSEPLLNLHQEFLLLKELEDDRRAKLWAPLFTLSASSSFFFPFFAGVGLTLLETMEKVVGFFVYSTHERFLLWLSIMFYGVFGTLFDSCYSEIISGGGLKKGLFFRFPILLSLFLIIFFSTRLLSKMFIKL